MPPATGAVNILEPLAMFSQCHADIVSRLQDADTLPRLPVAAERRRELAASLLSWFDDHVLLHHADEESILFPAVQRRAQAGAEAELARGMVERLAREHRLVEQLWRQVEPSIRRVAGGDTAEVIPDAMASLVHAYLEHVRFEEDEFLPLARQVLGRSFKHMAALGLALHQRHPRPPVGSI
jgi:hemerythrin-like domain-containing protein